MSNIGARLDRLEDATSDQLLNDWSEFLGSKWGYPAGQVREELEVILARKPIPPRWRTAR